MNKGLQHEQKAAWTTDTVWLSVAKYVNREVQHEQQLQSDSRLEYVNNGCSINTNCSVTKSCCVNTGLLYEQHLQHKGAVWQWVAVKTTVSMWLQVAVYVKIVIQCDYKLHRISIDSVSMMGCSMNNVSSIKLQFDNNGLQYKQQFQCDYKLQCMSR